LRILDHIEMQRYGFSYGIPKVNLLLISEDILGRRRWLKGGG